MFQSVQTFRFRVILTAVDYGHIVRMRDFRKEILTGESVRLMRRHLKALELCHANDRAAFVAGFDFLCEGYF